MQLSVFQCRLSRAEMLEMEAELRECLHQVEDHLLIIHLGGGEKVKPRIRTIGREFVPVKRHARAKSDLIGKGIPRHQEQHRVKCGCTSCESCYAHRRLDEVGRAVMPNIRITPDAEDPADTSSVAPVKPSHMTSLAEACLRQIVEHGFGKAISIGGGLGLLHYLDYRETNDIDAWWTQDAPRETRQQVIKIVETFLQQYGRTRIRQLGPDTTSVELLDAGSNRRSFSFQVSIRSAQIEPSVTAPWLSCSLESLTDLIASKATALINRGAPRDFNDIYHICRSGFATPERCWRLWALRQELSGELFDTQTARLAVETHLKEIELHRPLEKILDPNDRANSAALRSWFREVFLAAVV